MTAKPKRKRSKWWRQHARRIRDQQWRLMERMREHGTLWICYWNKKRRDELPDEARFGLLEWMEIGTWFDRHSDWFVIGEWDDDRYAAPWSLTDAGLQALGDRAVYDGEAVTGGMVEPGWTATPFGVCGPVLDLGVSQGLGGPNPPRTAPQR